MQLNKQAIADLITWVNAPTSAAQLFDILDKMSVADLNYAALNKDRTVARLAWVEFARRRDLIDFSIELVEIEDGLEVRCEGAAVPIAKQILIAQA